jgi:ornithine cyclodeaminase
LLVVNCCLEFQMRTTFVKRASMLLLGEKDVRKALSLTECLDINRQAYLSLANGASVVPSRLGLSYPDKTPSTSGETQDWTLVKPAAYYSDDKNDPSSTCMGLKVVSIRANNPSKGLPLVPATILLLEPETGIVQATLGGTYLTVARTCAGPALAIQTFAPNCQELVLFGAGAQAECHIQMMEAALNRPIPKITIVNRSLPRAQALLKTLDPSTHNKGCQVLLLDDHEQVAKALSTADVVATTTNTATPLWNDGSILKKNCLITSIGSYTPDMQEIPESAVDRCHVLIDTPDAMTVGDLKHLGGSLEATKHPVTLMGNALKDPSLVSGMDCIFYKAVGTAIQDVMTARLVVDRARAQGIGQEIDMS